VTIDALFGRGAKRRLVSHPCTAMGPASARVRIISAREATREGQVTIPRDVRERFGLKAGDKMSWSVLSDGTIVFRPKARRLLDLVGILDKAVPPGVHVAIEEMRLPE
jgi:AbrB family looped-hinge helix DNA binding protein